MDEIQNEPSKTPATENPAAKPDEALDRTPVKAKDARAKLVADLAAKRTKAAESDGDEDDDASAPKKSTTADKKEKSTGDDKSAKPAEAKLEAKIEAKELKLEDAGIEVDQRKNESDADYDLRLAKLLREKNEAVQDAAKAKKEMAKLAKSMENGRANPLTILEELGYSYEDLVKGINSKKFPAPGAKPTVPQEILDQIAELRKDKTDRESVEQARTLKAQSEARMASDTKKVSGFLEANSDDFPFLSSVPWAVQEILAQANAKKATDVGPIMRRLEDNLANNAEKLVMSDKAMRAAMKRNPELKAAFRKMVGDEEPTKKPKAKDDEDEEVAIRGLDDLTRDPPARSTKKTRAELKADMASEMKARRSKRDEEDD